MQSKLHKNIKIVRRGGTYKIRKVSVVPGVSGANVYAFINNNMENLLRGVNERIFYMLVDGIYVEPFKPEVKDYALLMKPFKDLFIKLVRHQQPLEIQQVPLLYTGRKRTIYQQAADDLDVDPIQFRDSFIKIFGKCEAYNLTAKELEEIVMRIISPRSRRYACKLATYIKVIEPLIYKIIDKIFNRHLPGQKSKTVIKGCNSRDAAKNLRTKYEQFDNPMTRDFDVKRLDQCLGVAALSFEHGCFTPFFTGHHRKELKELLSWQLKNKCTANCDDGFFKFTVDGGRASGDCNTACGNCLDMCAAFYSFLISLGIVKFAFVNNGDDCTLILEAADAAKVTEEAVHGFFSKIGFRMKMGPWVNKFEHIDFCQTRPVHTGSEWIMVRDPFQQASKDACCNKPFQTKEDFICWIQSVGMGGLSMTGGIPMQQEYYTCLLRNAAELGRFSRKSKLKRRIDQMREDSGFKMLAKGMNMKYSPVTDSARASFFEAFGIPPDLQIAIENDYKTTTFKWLGAGHKSTISRTPFHIPEREASLTMF